MAKGVQIALTLNPKEFIRGLKRIETSTEDVVDGLAEVADAGDEALDLDTRAAERGLEDVADAAEDASDSLEDIKDGAKDAERGLDGLGTAAKSELGKVETAAGEAGAELESELKDGTKDAEKAFDRLGSAAKADMKKVGDSADRAADNVDDIGKEAGSSAREFGSSFRGDPIEALEEVQSLGAEIASATIPGIGGAVAAIGGGILFGFITSQFERLKEQAEALREKVSELRDEYLELSEVDFASLGERNIVEDFIERMDEAGSSVEDFADVIKDASPEAQAAWERFLDTGSTEDFLAVQGELRTSINTVGDEYDSASKSALRLLGPLPQAYKDAASEADFARGAFSETALGIEENADASEDLTTATETLAEATQDTRDAVRDLGSEFGTADEAADNYQAALDDTTEATEELTKKGVQPLADGLAGETEAAREAKGVLRDLASDTRDAAAAQVDLEGDTAGAIQTTKDGRRAFIEAARQLGLSEQRVSTTITVDNTAALFKIAETEARLQNIQPKYVDVFITERRRDEAWASRAPSDPEG